MSLNPRVILFLGAPGSGKGTQSSWLSAQLGIPSLSTGALLRNEAKKHSPAAARLRQLLASGALVSDETVCRVVASRLRGKDGEHGAILDGFPRTVRQAAYLDGLLADLGMPRPTVIHLDVSGDGLLRRLGGRRQCASCGAVYNLRTRPSLNGSRCEADGGALIERDDDREEIILRRLVEFREGAAPLIAYYADADYYRVDGDRDVELVAADLRKITRRSEVLAAV